MPGLNGTGPNGMGPMTGWGRGVCNPARIPSDQAPAGYSGYGRGYGRGFGYGRGPGFGRGGRYWRGAGWRAVDVPAAGWYGPADGPAEGGRYPMRPEDEIGMLRDQAETVKNELDRINKRIEALEADASEQ